MEFPILGYQDRFLFCAIRSKIDYAKIILHSAQIILANIDATKLPTIGTMRLVVGKMSRLFFYKDGRFFSISFPFTVTFAKGEVELQTFTQKRKVTSKNIAFLLSILNDEHFQETPSLINTYFNFTDFGITDLDEDEDEDLDSLFFLLEEILQFEPGYLRYDIDEVREKGLTHPLHHLDINYSGSGTYKIGLKNAIQGVYFENLLDLRTDCSFLEDS